MAVEALVASAIAILSPYVAAGSTKAAEAAGTAIAEGAGKLLARIKDWFAADQEAETAIRNFETNPTRYESVVRSILLDKMSSDPRRAAELAHLVDAMGPRVEVFQKIHTLAGQAVGLDLAQWEAGLARAAQEVDVVAPSGILTGARIGDG